MNFLSMCPPLKSEDIERIQKRALRIMYPELKYHEALMESNLKTLTDRRDDMCVQLIKDMSNPNYNYNLLKLRTYIDYLQK